MTGKLQEAFKNLVGRKVDTFAAEVVSVDKNEGAGVVSNGEIEFTDVALSATVEDDGKRFYIFPKVGSFVLVSPIAEDIHRLYVEFFSEVESIDLKIEGGQMQIDNSGFLLKKENETLKKLMVDLLEAIEKMKFTTNQGPTLKLINKQSFTDIKNRFKTFLKDS